MCDVSGRVTSADLGGMAGLVALAGAVLVLWAHLGGELIPFKDGTGYDGYVYAAMAADPLSMDELKGFDTHRAQRVVPSLLAGLVLAPLRIEDWAPAVVLWFHVYDFVLIALATVLWWRTCRHLAVRRPSAWVGFCGLVANYGVLKFTGYYPVLTDVSGFFLGMVVVWLWVERRDRWLPVVAVVGAFTWPTAAYAALLLFSFSRPAPMPDPRTREQRTFAVVVAALLAAGVATAAGWARGCPDECVTEVMRTATMDELFPVSLALLTAAVFLATLPVLRHLSVGSVLASLRWERAVLSVAVLVGSHLVLHAVADPSGATATRTLANTALGGAVKPLGFLVAHVAYYGVMLVLLVLVWPRAVRAAARFGPGFLGLLLGFLLLGVSAESRILMNQWPLFVLLGTLAVDRLEWSRLQAAAFGVLAVVQSRVWFPLNRGPLTGDSAEYPDQWYGMSVGTRMTVPSYLAMTAVAVASVVVMTLILRARPRRPAAASGPAPEPVAAGSPTAGAHRRPPAPRPRTLPRRR